VRNENEGHFGTIVGRGGSGKSILALQVVTELLRSADANKLDSNCPNAAFYFSLEASPKELQRQVEQFEWGQRYQGKWERPGDSNRHVSGEDEYAAGLYIISIPLPAESLNAVSLKIRQTIASQLRRFNKLAAIVIDPMGAVNAGEDLRTNLIQLKELADSHGTFVFLLTEKYAFEEFKSIEHYSQSIIHLEHDPDQQQHRRLYVQKARGQSFRSGYHYLELQQPQSHIAGSPTRGISKGIRVFPSIAAQSAYAHERLSGISPQIGARKAYFFPDEKQGAKDTWFLSDGEKIERGSAVFLMGPPGTFKEHVATQFADAAASDPGGHGATIYVSFKADFQAILKVHEKALRRDSKDALNRGNRSELDRAEELRRPEQIDFKTRLDQLRPKIYFLDARSPLLTPEEILFTVRNAITSPVGRTVHFSRAVIWGLRRLYDFPNFGGGRVIQFLEALVTLLKSEQITTLLVDWPDKQVTTTVPIVDLCQYIFLTRVCYTPESPTLKSPKEDGMKREKLVRALWRGHPRQVALLRAQRTREGVHHDEGAIFQQVRKGRSWEIQRLSVAAALPKNVGTNFEQLWLRAGVQWEEDLSLLS